MTTPEWKKCLLARLLIIRAFEAKKKEKSKTRRSFMIFRRIFVKGKNLERVRFYCKFKKECYVFDFLFNFFSYFLFDFLFDFLFYFQLCFRRKIENLVRVTNWKKIDLIYCRRCKRMSNFPAPKISMILFLLFWKIQNSKVEK